MLDRLTVASFAPTLGDTYILVDAELRLDLELIEATAHPADAPPTDAEGRRTPFSLLFRGPVEPVLAQRIQRLEHDALGPLELFLVPVGRDAAGTRYEAVFG
ncbi:MAG TPA: hypothetical protein VFG42_23415 [Baekduia sp.]|uniref:DUF6916 family protein n=1 Tax=Baekduia sp. TaxID=2600305 RepID=UPI002D7888E4|nr:hypothetical protein [Baekduia sp.]HET6509762.1 hypothetical protein [Baekduia sp.]